MNAAPCGCQSAPAPGPWCPFRAARVEARRAAETYGSALRGEPQAKARVSRIAQAVAKRDPRAARAAKQLDDAGKAHRIASRAHKGDRKAQQAIDSMRERREADAAAAGACSMVEFFLDLPPSELDSFELMTHQFDTDPDAWLYEEFTQPQLATALVDSENYNWPV